MSQSNEISNRTVLAICIASFAGMLTAVTIMFVIIMPMMKVNAAPAASTAGFDPAYAAYVQGYLASSGSGYGAGSCTEEMPAGKGAGVHTEASPGYTSTSIGTWKPMGHHDLHKSFKKWAASHNTYTYHNTSNVNSHNTLDSNNKWDNSSNTSIEIDDSFNGKNSQFVSSVNQENKVINHSFNDDSYNNSQDTTNTTVVDDSFNKETEVKVEDSFNTSKVNTEVTTNTEVNKEVNIEDSFNKTLEIAPYPYVN